tara:strand:- start:2207 stop:2368 length:162 start_codon:yes stop_codon:yes gene_type:complete
MNETFTIITSILFLANILTIGINIIILGITYKVYSEFAKIRLHDDRFDESKDE